MLFFHFVVLVCVGLMVLFAFAPGFIPNRWEGIQFLGLLSIVAAIYATQGKRGP